MPTTRAAKIFNLLKSRQGEWLDRYEIARLINENPREIESELRKLVKRECLIRERHAPKFAKRSIWLYAHTADCNGFKGHYLNVAETRDKLKQALTEGHGRKFKSKADLFRFANVAYGAGDYALRSWPYLSALAFSAIERQYQIVPKERNTTEDVRIKVQCAISEAEFSNLKFKSFKSFIEYAGVSLGGFKSFCYRYPNQKRRIACNLLYGATEAYYPDEEIIIARYPSQRLNRVALLLEQATPCQYQTIQELCQVAGVSQCYLQKAFQKHPRIRSMAVRACRSLGMSQFIAFELAELQEAVHGELTFAKIAASVDISYAQLTYYCQNYPDIKLLVEALKNPSLIECKNSFNLHSRLRLPKSQLTNGLCDHCNRYAQKVRQRHRELDRLQIQNLRKEKAS